MNRRPPRRRAALRGFSLIEALVALIIAAISLSAVLELQRQLADGQARYERTLELAQLQRDGLALTADINPTAQPEGAIPLAAGRSLRWRAVPRSAPALDTGSAIAGRRFEMRLYRVTVEILEPSGAEMGEVAFDRLGWRRLERAAPFVRPPTPVAPTPQPSQSPPSAPTEPTL